MVLLDYTLILNHHQIIQYNAYCDGGCPKTMDVYWCGSLLTSITAPGNQLDVYTTVVTAPATRQCTLTFEATSAGGGGV